MSVYIHISDGTDKFKVGDRVEWCQDCYGEVTFIWKDMVGVVTEDGVSRFAGEEYLKKRALH